MSEHAFVTDVPAQPKPSRPEIVRASPIPACIEIDRLHDPVVEALELPVHCRYVETFWLPVIGPSALWLLRHAAIHTEGGRYTVDSDVLARSLGISHRGGCNSVLARSLDRVIDFRCAERVADSTWLMRTHLAPVTRRQLERMPEVLQEAHRRWELTR